MQLPVDPRWPRAAHQFSALGSSKVDAILVGIPAHNTSISHTGADKTPDAIREALLRYSLAHSHPDVDLQSIAIADAGNFSDPDSRESELIAHITQLRLQSEFLIALGGDNSITFATAQGTKAQGLITFDAHYDLRDGVSNGSPVRRLIEAGLSGRNIVQIGIADFSNSPEYAARAREFGITVIHRSAMRTSTIDEIWRKAIDLAGSQIHVDFDMDVCDRSVVPACPASAPGGISADEIRQFAFLAGSTSHVTSIDITEVDVTADTSDQRTVRLAALVVLEALAGFSTRR